MARKARQPLHVFCDFDGTISRKDIGDAFIQHFGEFEPHHGRLLAGEIRVAEYWRIALSTFGPDAGEEAIRAFARQQELDPYFAEFREFCRRRGIPLTIVSDGFDTYIETLLDQHSLADIPVFCNRLTFSGPSPVPFYPMASESCTCFCASCKRNALLDAAHPDSILVFVGDGRSDACAAEHADVIFAKGHLAAFCNAERLPHYPWKNFFDVKRLLENALRDHKTRPRHQAFLKRKEAFETE